MTERVYVVLVPDAGSVPALSVPRQGLGRYIGKAGRLVAQRRRAVEFLNYTAAAFSAQLWRGAVVHEEVVE